MNHRVLHFVVGGVALFAINAFLRPPGKPAAPVAARAPIVISSARIAQLRHDYTRETGLVASRQEEQRLIERAIEEEVLYREALARGLHLGDRSIRYRLIQKMSFLASEEADEEKLYRQALELDLGREDVVIRRLLIHKIRFVMKLSSGVGEPTDAELLACLERKRDRYLQPARISFTHVFLGTEKYGESLASEARHLLARIRAESVRPGTGVALGDRFPLGHEFRLRSEKALEKTFGSEFARIVFGLDRENWSGLVRSGYGLHLVWVAEIRPARLPALEDVRARVAGALIHEERERRYREMLARLRQQYDVRVERAAAEVAEQPS